MEKRLENGLVLRNCRLEDCSALEAVQRAAFPTLSEDELLTAPFFRQHIERFSDGQFAIFDGEKLVASTSSMRCRFDFAHVDHRFFEFSGGLTFSTHDPAGDWLYGADMGVLAEYRGRGLARQLYRARQELCRRLDLKGQIIAGMPVGFDRFRSEMTIDDYFEKIKSGEIHDPTVGVQLRMGAEIVALVKNYLDDPACDDAGILMVLRVQKDV